MLVIVSGLPGAGKTSLVRGIARKFKLKAFLASSILKEIMESELKEKTGIPVDKGFWETKKGREFAQKRLSNPEFDLKLDRKLLEIAKKGKNLVMDSRTMPWLSKKGYKVFISAPEKTRIGRIAKRDGISLQKARSAVQRLRTDIRLYKKLYGIEFGKDFSVFDIIIDSENVNEKEVIEIVSSEIREYFKKSK